jgi:hypothetical protein
MKLTVESLMGAIIYGSCDDWQKFASLPGFEDALAQLHQSVETEDALFYQAVDEMSQNILNERSQRN